MEEIDFFTNPMDAIDVFKEGQEWQKALLRNSDL